MTIYELKALNTKNGGLWFSRENMKWSKETLKDFYVLPDKTGPVVIVNRKTGCHTSFDRKTGRTIIY